MVQIQFLKVISKYYAPDTACLCKNTTFNIVQVIKRIVVLLKIADFS